MFFSSRRRHTRYWRDWSSDVCSSDLTDKDFQVIFFLMPNGDIYLIEPYSQQQNLTGNNFAFRDYYKGAVESRNTYLSDVIISAALGRPQANIAVPMYSENNGTLVGLWAGGLKIGRASCRERV